MARLTTRASGRSVVDLASHPMAPPELVIKAILDGVDAIARQMERKWGVGRLRLLVDDALRIKFDAQKAKLDAAIAADQETYIRAQAEGMRRAWLALDRAATEDGAQPLAPEVWECVLPASGEVVSIVRTEAEAHHVARDGEVWTLGRDRGADRAPRGRRAAGQAEVSRIGGGRGAGSRPTANRLGEGR